MATRLPTTLVLLALTAKLCSANMATRLTLTNSVNMLLRVVSTAGDKSTWQPYYVANGGTVQVQGYNSQWDGHDVFLPIQRYCPNVTEKSIFNDGWVTVGYVYANNPSVGLPHVFAGMDCSGDMDQGCSMTSHDFILHEGDVQDFTLSSHDNNYHMALHVKRNGDSDCKEMAVTVQSVPPVCTPGTACGNDWRAHVC